MRYLLTIIAAIMLSGCWMLEHNTEYNRSMTSMKSSSGEIRISIPHKKSPPFYMILESELDNRENKDVLRLRWVNKDQRYTLFNGMKTELRFVLDEDKVILMYPRSLPRKIGYNLNDHSQEEEAVFNITRDQLKRLAYAKSVDVELRGNKVVVVGHFTKYHTFRAFRKFVEMCIQFNGNYMHVKHVLRGTAMESKF